MKGEEKEDKKKKKLLEVSPEDRKTTKTAFILMFPALILCSMAAVYAKGFMSIIAVALALYQFLMLKQFIEDYYKK